jgi:hypothetical protein
MTLTDATGFVDDNLIAVADTDNSQVYFGRQVGAPVGNTITLDRPLDFTYVSGLTVTRNRTNMNIDGSGGTQTFGLRQGIPNGLELTVDVVRVVLTMYTSSAPTLATFGNLPKLTMGVTLRRRDGNRVNIFNFKDNGEFAGIAYDMQFLSAIGQGQDGVVGRLTFGGWSKMGAVVRLAPDEDIELLVNDNLSALQKFEVIPEGSIAITD